MQCSFACSAVRVGWRRLAATGTAILAVLMAVGAAGLAAPTAASEGEHALLVFGPPVDAAVSDPFRPSEGPYGPGNRGVEYYTEPGDVVRAGAAGTVSFAGAVAGSLYVTVDHGGGVLSSYSYLGRISVRAGSRVEGGDPVGTAGERRFHFSVRVYGEYVDPAGFAGVRRVRVRLVPLRNWRPSE